MTLDTLAAALEREHREIDDGVAKFLAARAQGRQDSASLRNAVSALRRHIFLEEEFLFPPLRDTGLAAPIFVMLREHGEIWDSMDTIDALLRSEPGDVVSEEACRQLLAQLEQHNSKEEAIIYPQADALLSAGADAELRAFLAGGQMPNGWRCKRAGA